MTKQLNHIVLLNDLKKRIEKIFPDTGPDNDVLEEEFRRIKQALISTLSTPLQYSPQLKDHLKKIFRESIKPLLALNKKIINTLNSKKDLMQETAKLKREKKSVDMLIEWIRDADLTIDLAIRKNDYDFFQPHKKSNANENQDLKTARKSIK